MTARTTYSDYFCLRRKFLLYNLIARNLKIRYRHSILGMVWTVLIPAATAAIFFVIFGYIFKVNIPNYLLFLLSGLIPWTFFSTALGIGTETLVNNYNLLNKVPLPIQSLLYSEALTQLFNLLFSIPVLIAAMMIYHVPATLASAQYIVLLGILFIITYAFCLLFGLVYVYFRDLKQIVILLLQLWLYGTPVMYSLSMIPKRFDFLVALNPVGDIFIGFHQSLLYGKWLSLNEWAIILGWTVGLLLLSKFALDKMRDSVVEVL